MKDDVGGEHDKMEGVGRGSWLHRQGPGVRFAGIIDDTAEALRRGWGISMLIQSWERIPRYLPAKFAHHPHNSITNFDFKFENPLLCFPLEQAIVEFRFSSRACVLIDK
ncbi:hypothetical protein V6N13_066306 [Hibiscus sabdariffa]